MVHLMMGGAQSTTTGRSYETLGFDHEGMFIHDPTASESGRFAVDPLEYYGLTADQAEALRKVQDLSREFRKELIATIGADGAARAAAANGVEADPLVCHSHDECCANECMLAAMATLGISLRPDDQLQCDIINSAWNLAKAEDFR